MKKKIFGALSLICISLFVFNSVRIQNKLKHIFFVSKFYVEEILHKKSDVCKLIIEKDKLIAHAGGIINGLNYTNSLEALNYNYNKGFRLFELDINLTSDNVLVAVHNWEEWKSRTNFTGNLPPTHKEFMENFIYAKYTPLDISDINDWFSIHNDAILITDKLNDPQIFSMAFKFNNRLIMELFTWKSVNKAINIGVTPMLNWSMLYYLSDNEILTLLELKKIKYIAAENKTIFSRRKILKTIKNRGIKVYSYGSYGNNCERPLGEKNEYYVMDKESDYFYGIYADYWNTFKN